MPRRYTPLRLGFTLVEVLIVVSILSVLAALLLPSLGRARDMARLAACKANLNAQTRAHHLYGHNHNDYKPALYREGRSSVRKDWVSPSVKWMQTPVGQGILVAGEYLVFEALLCPSASMSRDAALDTAAWKDLINSGSSYAYFWRHPEDIEHPSQIAHGATYDHVLSFGRGALVMDINCAEGHQYTGDYEDHAWRSHPPLDKVNVAFASGAVISADGEGLRLEYPAGPFEELLWFQKAHELR